MLASPTSPLPGAPTEISGVRCLGTHSIVELLECVDIDDAAFVEKQLVDAALAAGATVLKADVHQFVGGGVTGIVLLAESHISIHTWPERHYAAVDIFVCGTAATSSAIESLKRSFKPRCVIGQTLLRGASALDPLIQGQPCIMLLHETCDVG